MWAPGRVLSRPGRPGGFRARELLDVRYPPPETIRHRDTSDILERTHRQSLREGRHMSSNNDGERTVADRYVLRRELGRGGMGIVWEAYDPELHRDVAIKQVLLPGHFTPEERDDAHARVRREARSAARVSHPTVITIHDVFEHDGSPWVVMELVEGGSLRDMLNEQGALEVSLVAKIGESLLQAVHYANQAGVLHRDIKPGNIMMSADGRVILTDFGIATIEGGPSITRTGALIGSPEYMAPERLEGAEAEHRNDLWSIGVTLFAAVEGHSPFGRDNITSAIAAVISGPIPQMERAGGWNRSSPGCWNAIRTADPPSSGRWTCCVGVVGTPTPRGARRPQARRA